MALWALEFAIATLEASTLPYIIAKPRDASRQALHIAGLHNQPGLPSRNHFRHAASPADHGGQARRLGFYERGAQAFRFTGKERQGTGGPEWPQVAHKAKKMDLFPQRQFFRCGS